MQLRFSRSTACLLSVLVLVLAAPVMADEYSTVQFITPDGAVMTDCNVGVVTIGENGERIFETHPASPNGTYVVNVAPGQKAVFILTDDSNQFTPIERQLPVGVEGPVTITVNSVLAGDQCQLADDGDAEVLPALIAGSTVGVMSDSLVAGGFCGTSINDPSAGQWYKVVGNGNQFTASTCENSSSGSATFDTKISVFCLGCGAEPQPLTCVGGNDDEPSCDFHSTFSWGTQDSGDPANPAEYLIYVHGFGAATGDFNLSVVDDGVPGDVQVDCVPPPPPIPTGACCNCLASPFNCTIETEEDCAALNANIPSVELGYLGDDTTCFVESATQTIFEGTGGDIPDASVVGLTTQIVVADDFIIGDLDVGAAVTHTWTGDLLIELTHEETGTAAVIVDRIGVPESAFGCSQDNWAGVILDDEGADGAIDAASNCVPDLAGSFTPDNPLGVFDGESSAGTWTLLVLDLASPDPGSLTSWNLQFRAGEPACTEFVPPTGNGDCEDDDPQCPLDDDGDATICHIPPGNPGNAHTISVGASAIDAHLGHGDTCGPCPDDGENDGVSTVLEVVGQGNNLSEDGLLHLGFNSGHQGPSNTTQRSDDRGPRPSKR